MSLQALALAPIPIRSWLQALAPALIPTPSSHLAPDLAPILIPSWRLDLDLVPTLTRSSPPALDPAPTPIRSSRPVLDPAPIPTPSWRKDWRPFSHHSTTVIPDFGRLRSWASNGLAGLKSFWSVVSKPEPYRVAVGWPVLHK